MKDLKGIIDITFNAVIIEQIYEFIKTYSVGILQDNRVIKYDRQILTQSFEHNLTYNLLSPLIMILYNGYL